MIIYEAVAPANIALLKYWGRLSLRPRRAATPSLSVTLSRSVSVTRVEAIPEQEATIKQGGHQAKQVTMFFPCADLSPNLYDRISYLPHDSGMTNQVDSQFLAKIAQQVQFIRRTLGGDSAVSVVTENNFPVGVGLASSASGFAALTVATAACFWGVAEFSDFDQPSIHKLAMMAKEGSGSAGRSLFGGFVSWRSSQNGAKGSIAQEFPAHHMPLADTIFVFSQQPKKVSSSDGHQLAQTSQLYQLRVQRSESRFIRMRQALLTQDFTHLGELMEQDAIDMHGICLTSTPPVSYLTEDSLKFMNWLVSQRNTGQFEAYFTVDAGPNVHVISKVEDQSDIINRVLEVFQVESVIVDRIGSGPRLQRITN
ncbi:MAG: diphosphomevalonate decarboxylase [Proteobacteria bacterium]|nr:diphosphomevalonate decarboxylase [Pseudomonadota bacterium]